MAVYYAIDQTDSISHHGIKGMKWGVRRFQNPDGTLIKTDNSVRRKTKYTNDDGSLNERGKTHSRTYINRQTKRNNKYYERRIRKYEKLAEKYKDNPELRKKFQAMKKDAIRTRESVNKSIKEMSIDAILAAEAQARYAAVKVGSATSGTMSNYMPNNSGTTAGHIDETVNSMTMTNTNTINQQITALMNNNFMQSVNGITINHAVNHQITALMNNYSMMAFTAMT